MECHTEASGPAALLRPENGVVDFLPRPDLVDRLLAWARDKDARPVILLHGAGGVCKTRLSLQLAHRLQRVRRSHNATALALGGRVRCTSENIRVGAAAGADGSGKSSASGSDDDVLAWAAQNNRGAITEYVSDFARLAAPPELPVKALAKRQRLTHPNSSPYEAETRIWGFRMLLS
jgi:hypothetical protein